MVKIDVKDRKILYQLDLDSRQSFRSIGRKVGLTKDVIASRVKKLQETGVIKNFYTIIDAYKLGYTFLRFYLKYQYVNPELKKEIINYFVKSKYSLFVLTLDGNYDLVIFMGVKNLPEFYYFWEKTLDRYRNYFTNQVFTIYFQEHIFRYSTLLNEEIDRTKVLVYGDTGRVDIDDLDFQILELLASNARMPTIKIAKTLNSTATIVNYRIKKMRNLGVIQGFRTDFDLSQFGYKIFKVDIVLEDHNKKQQILNYVYKNPNLIARDVTLGYVDLELDFHLRNADQLHQIMENITAKFPNTINNYSYFSIKKVHKYRYIPEER